MSMKKLMAMIEQHPRLSQAMRRLQLTEKTIHLLPIFPLIYVAWADGKFQEAAVERILQIAEENGLTEGEGSGLLSFWLHTDKRPSDEFFLDGLRLTAAILKYARPGFKNNIIFLCESVAESVGGWSGVKRTEQEALTQIADLLKIKGAESYHTLIARMRMDLESEDLDFLPTHVKASWVTINAVLSAGIAAVIFYALWKLYPKLVVTETHAMYFLLVLLIAPQVGFFVTNMLTARLSPGDTRRESLYGTGLALLMVLVVGGLLSGQVAKKYVGFNVARPDTTPMMFPACDNTPNSSQRCVRMAQHQNNTVCRLMPNRIFPLVSYPMGHEGRDWFGLKNCQEDRSTGILLYRISASDRFVSAGYYPLCSDLSANDRQACIVMDTHPTEQTKACRILPDPQAKAGNWGKKYENWYPQGRACAPLYARVYAVWTKEGRQLSFYGYRPLCKDVMADQPCLYINRIQRPDLKQEEKVCVLSESRTIPAEHVNLANVPYVNWFPREECKPLDNPQVFAFLFAALGFAFFAMIAAYAGAWVGVRWQGTR